MRINKSIATIAGSALIVPLLASSASAADIQIWSNEKELENGNHLILDADNTGGDIFLQFGNTLGESLSWDSANARFNLSNSLNVEGNISLTGNVEMLAGTTVDGVDVSELGTQSATNAANIATNATNIAGNTTNIATNTTDISALEAEQITQNTNISNNTSNISALQTEQSAQAGRLTTNEADIDALETKAGDTNFTGANYLVFGNNLTQGLITLDAQIKTNANNTLTNTTNIASNDTDISALQTEQSAQDARLTTNEADIDALELAQATPKTESLLIPLGNATIKEDGTNNTVNVFRSAEDGVFGHNYHKVVSSQASLQDIDINFKLQVPADVKSVETLTFSYKTDSAATDSKLDISVVDSSGATIATSTNLSGTSWSDIILDLSGHTAVAGEFLTVEITGYSKGDNASYLGELSLNYKEIK